MGERVFRLSVLVRIGNVRWRVSEKHYCDDEKKLPLLIKKHKKVVDRRNTVGIRTAKIIVEEFVNGIWSQIEEYPIASQDSPQEKKVKNRKEKWDKYMEAVQAELDRQRKKKSE